jgi:hypothetical protein
MVINDLDKHFFTNTYITGSGRQNYLRIDHLEDPLFTSFTFDIDYVTSPLFYTINYSDYGYPNVEGMADKIESALKYMYNNDIYVDEGYEMLPLLSASILDGNKLGFGLQQNVYLDMPLYGATEYIYMVDKRNGGTNQNDAKFDSNQFVEYGGNPNALNGYKLGDTVKDIVNDSDKAWAERQLKQNEEQISICDDIMNETINDHKSNMNEVSDLMNQCNNVRGRVEGENGEFTESELQNKIDELKKIDDEFEQFKRQIVDWANGELSKYKTRGTEAYIKNECIRKIETYSNITYCGEEEQQKYKDELKKLYGDNYIDKINSFLDEFEKIYGNLEEKFLKNIKEDRGDINSENIINKFQSKLEYFGLYNKDNKNVDGTVQVISINEPPNWLNTVGESLYVFVENPNEKIKKIKKIMTFQCDVESSFDDFKSNKTNDDLLSKYKSALDDVKTQLYGYRNGSPCDKSDPTPESLYGRYLEAKEKCENDEYSQAEKTKSLAQSGMREMTNMIRADEHTQDLMDRNYDESIQKSVQPMEVSRTESIVVTQTVLDILGFISGMKKMTTKYPYIIQGVTGLDTAYNKHYGIKDPYLGSGDDKITLTCLESLDLRVSSMFNRYFNAIYDRQYRRERVPVNLRRFNCSIYVHDVRNFVSKIRVDENGNKKMSYNKILELTDMYYSVIEFRFFDCEIVPEETGNIFNDISNESPSEMKKTNFTFTYGNCVVNFVPQSEVSQHNM